MISPAHRAAMRQAVMEEKARLDYRYSPEGIAIRSAIFDAEARGDWDAVREGEERLVDLLLLEV